VRSSLRREFREAGIYILFLKRTVYDKYLTSGLEKFPKRLVVFTLPLKINVRKQEEKIGVMNMMSELEVWNLKTISLD